MLCNFLRCHHSLPLTRCRVPSTTMSGLSPFVTGPRLGEDPLPQCPPRPPAQLLGGQRSSAPLPLPASLLVPRCLNPQSMEGLVPAEGGAGLEDLEPHPAPASPRGTAETQSPPFPVPHQGGRPRSHETPVASRVDAARPVGHAHRPRARPGPESAFASAVHTSLPSPRCPLRQDVGTGWREGGVFLSPSSPSCWDLSEHAE